MTAKEALKIAEANKFKRLFGQIDSAALNGATYLLVIGLSQEKIKMLESLGYTYDDDGILSWKDAK